MIGYKHIILVIFISFAAIPLVFATPKTESLDRIVAVINDKVITESELNEAISAVKKQLKSSNVSFPTPTALHKQVLDQLINKKLQMELAEHAGISVSDNDVDKAIHTIATNNKLSVNEVYKKIAEQGLTVKDYRKEIHEELLLEQIQQQAVGAKLNITPQEINDFMRSKTWQAFNTKEYHLEDILIALPEAPSPEDLTAAKKHANEVLAKIRGGMSFTEAAASESGEKNALQGGDLGWRKLPEIPTIFADELIHMKKNDLMGPVQTPNGFHIVHLVDIRNVNNKMDPTAERHQVEQLIFQRKLEEALQSWITKLRSEAYINLHPEEG